MTVTDNNRNQRWVTVHQEESGEIVFSAVDSGPLVESVWGDSDYEFWYRVQPDSLNNLATRIGSTNDSLLDDLKAHWLKERFSELQDILREPDIDAKFSSY